MLPSHAKVQSLAAEIHTQSTLLDRDAVFGAVYEDNYRLLVSTAIKRYRISHGESAESNIRAADQEIAA